MFNNALEESLQPPTKLHGVTMQTAIGIYIAARSSNLRCESCILIRPVVMYGEEFWLLTNKAELQLAVFERKVLRKIFGLIRQTNHWRRRFNEELYQLYGEPEIVKWIRPARLGWAYSTHEGK
jgi:hypothetical protein